MQLLIVHRDADVGEQLLAMVHDYTANDAHLARSSDEALAWSLERDECDLLLMQLEAEPMDGLNLGAALSEKFPRLQTIFLPAYRVSDQRLEVTATKVFPEPIDGERLLNAIARAESPPPEMTDPFHVVDVLQMCCLSARSGGIQLVKLEKTGVVFLDAGRFVHAETAALEGADALYEMVAWDHVEFAYDGVASAPRTTIAAPWEELLVDAVLRHKQAKPAYDRPPENAPDAASGTWTGRQFGSYRVGRKLTESFWDEVYEAEETAIGRTAALHVLRAELRHDETRAQEFLADASANASVDNPAIVSVYEAGEANGTYFYAREFVVGDTLEELQMRGRPIPEPLALRIIAAVADGLAYLDRSGIKHAPLRTSRILVGNDGRARLADIAVGTPASAQTAPARSEIQMLARVLLPLVKPSTAPGSGRVVSLVHKMHSSTDESVSSWPALAELARRTEAEIMDAAPAEVAAAKNRTTRLLGRFLGRRRG